MVFGAPTLHLPPRGITPVLSVRPKVADLLFQFYGRSLHPELFVICETRTVERGPYTASIHITSAGHLITWQYQGLTLTEVAASAEHPLPQKRRLLSHRLRGQRSDHVQCRGGVRYQVSFQLETVEPETFWNFHEELLQDGAQRGVLHRFGSANRIHPGAISYLNVETSKRTMIVHSFHTFPSEFAIVKSQSLYELPRQASVG